MPSEVAPGHHRSERLLAQRGGRDFILKYMHEQEALRINHVVNIHCASICPTPRIP